MANNLNNKDILQLAKKDFRELQDKSIVWESFYPAYVLAFNRGYIHAINYGNKVIKGMEQDNG